MARRWSPNIIINNLKFKLLYTTPPPLWDATSRLRSMTRCAFTMPFMIAWVRTARLINYRGQRVHNGLHYTCPCGSLDTIQHVKVINQLQNYLQMSPSALDRRLAVVYIVMSELDRETPMIWYSIWRERDDVKGTELRTETYIKHEITTCRRFYISFSMAYSTQ